MNKPLVSIIMPVYNAGSYLRDAVHSVITQDYENWELLMIDDGSEDNSLSIASSFDDGRIRVFVQDNRGVANARNTGLAAMQGEFFCFLDADDMLPEHSISARIACFESDDICFADGVVEIFNHEMTKMERIWIPEKVEDHFRSLVRLDGKCFFGPSWMIRRTPSVTFRFDDELTHGEELFFYMSYANLGKYASTSEVVLRYRKSANSAMSNLNGLANGYTMVGKRLKTLPCRVSLFDRLIFNLKSRKIIFLSFFRRQPALAIRYLISGTL